MRKFSSALMAFALIVFGTFAAQAQTTGSISGSVVDPNGAVVPGATVKVTGEAGQKFTAETSQNGTYKIPNVQNGTYTVTITARGFKTTEVSNVKVFVNTPTPVDAKLELGTVGETVEITSGGEVLQTETPTVGTTITGRQITETPIASRDALDLVGLLPGTATVGRPRQATINGLPKGALNVTIDGVDVQDNLLRSTDGYFTYVRPRVDAIDEVTVSTAVPGAEASGDGAISIAFVTRRGTNNYNGGGFWQHRDESLNANYWYQNRDGKRDDNGKAYRQKIRLNQFGAHFGGPIPFPRFGDGGGPYIDSGKDKAFFFVNYEQYRIPSSMARTRTILTPAAQAGTYSYTSGGTTRTANVYDIATANGQLATADPSVAALLAQIRTGVNSTGTTSATSNLNTLTFNFTPSGSDIRKFLALRFDVNVTKNHSVDFVINRQTFVPSKDFLNSQDERFPGLPWYTQSSNRDSYALGVRSTLANNLINYARYTISTGQSFFSQGISTADYGNQGGYDLGINAAFAITTATSRNSYSDRNTPTYAFDDSLTWIKGSHTMTFGGSYKRIKYISNAIGRIVPTVGFGIDVTEDRVGVSDIYDMFNATSLPASTAAQQAEARALYATLIGHVISYSATAYQTADGTYKIDALQAQSDRQDTWGVFGQDQWKIRPNLTLNFGLRWQPQGAYTVLTDNYAALASPDDVYGQSGPNGLFKPGATGGNIPSVIGLHKGDKAYEDNGANFAPSVGVVWAPEFKSGLFRSVFGGSGKSVFRGGYSRAYVREGMALIGSILGANPGGSISASRSLSIGNLTTGTNLCDANNTNLSPDSTKFPTSASYPFNLSTTQASNTFIANLKTGYVDSYTFGYQRELNKNTVVEVRYVGNRGYKLIRQHNINELNTIENGFADEFKLAQANLFFNIANGRGNTFAYTGAGTSPLPKMLAYINTAATFDPNNTARYNSSLFTNATLLTQLSRANPALIGFAGNIENSAARRANAIANGLPANFFYVNSVSLTGGAFVVDNSAESQFDSGVVELRRRLSQGLRIQASYVWSKALSNAFMSNSDNYANFTMRPDGLALAEDISPYDIAHQLKIDATYDLPFGRGRKFLGNANRFVDAILGGWTLSPTAVWHTGVPISFGNVTLVGMTARDLEKAIGVYKNTMVPSGADGTPATQFVTYLPLDIIQNTRRAFDVTATGYAGTYGGAPSGRFIAPAGYGNCISRYAGECGFNNLVVHGPGYFKLDSSLGKQFKITEKTNIQIRATFLDVLNMPNFRVGGWTADVNAITAGGASFGQMGLGSAYQDVSTTNDPGGRLIDLMLRINF